MATIFLHPSLGKLSGAEQVPFVECLMQLDAAWLSRRINYPPSRFRQMAEGIIEAKKGVGLDDLLSKSRRPPVLVLGTCIHRRSWGCCIRSCKAS